MSFTYKETVIIIKEDQNKGCTEIREVFSNAYKEAFRHKEELDSIDLYTDLKAIDERYEKIKFLGEGAAKKVWLVKDNLLDRQVTLAEIKTSDRNLATDFLNEARLASKLEHSSIAPIYDLGFTQDEKPFFVMKYYEGETLREKLLDLQKQPSSKINWLIETFLKVCEAVSYAHSRQILHLDIKPSNIRINDFGEVLLCDWGISKFYSQKKLCKNYLEENHQNEIISRSTLIGEVKGTPGFMAPEQLSIDLNFSQQTDVYGLGSLLCDMFTGSPMTEVLEIKKIKCPQEIKSIIQKSTQPKPQDRYKSVQDLITDIENFKHGMVTIAEEANIFTILKKWIYRHRKAAFSLSTNFLIISLLIFTYIRNINEANSELANLVTELKTAKIKKQNEQLKLADKYLQQSNTLFRNAITRLDYNLKDIQLAHDLIIRSLELNPTNIKAWHKDGRLKLISNDYEAAIESFKKGKSESTEHLKSTELLLARHPSPQHIDAQIFFLNLVNKLDDHYLRNSLIFKNIHSLKGDDLLQYAIQAMRIIHDLDSINWEYDKEKNSLDLSHNNIVNLFPIRTLRVNHLNLSHTNLRYVQINHLRSMPIYTLDLSYSAIKNLSRFLNQEVINLNLEGSAVVNLSDLVNSKVRKLNIYKTNASLRKLDKMQYLEEVICSIEQAEILRRKLSPTVKLVIKND